MDSLKANVIEWSDHIQEERIIHKDPLLQCLCFITKFYHKPLSADTLTAGLPIAEGTITPDLFVRAAKRAGLSARVSERYLEEFTELMLPVVLLLNNGDACVLTNVNVDGSLTIVQPETGIGSKVIDRSALEKHYSGFALLIKPKYDFHKEQQSLDLPEKGHWFWNKIREAWPVYSEMLVASLLINIFALALPLFVMNVYDRVVPNYAVDTLWVLGIGVFIVLAFDFMMRLLRSYFIDVAGKNIDIHLSAEIFEKILGLKMAVRPKSVGSMVNTVTAYTAFRDFVTSASISAIVDFPFILLFLIVIAYIAGPLVIVPLAIIPTIFIVSYIIQLPLNKEAKKLYQSASDKDAILFEALNGIETVKAIGAEAPLQSRWERAICYSAKHILKVRFLSNLSINFSLFMQYFSTVLVIIVGVYLITTGRITVGALVACTILSGRVLAPIMQMSGLIARYYQSATAYRALSKVMDAKVDRPRGKNYLYHPQFEGDIEFRKVNFAYPDQKVKALDEVSFSIKPGEKVAVIGRVGSGKSTIDKLILNLYQPDSGNILIDGTDIQQINPVDLRHHIGFVPQNIVLFNGSVQDNITFAAPYVTGTAIRKASQISQVERFTSKHPDGIEMPVGEKGEAISGGQRQSVAIARALLLDPQIIIMDEPTSSMDERTEHEFVSDLKEHIEGKTFIIVTHRASMLALVDRLIVLEAGSIIADGPKERIIAALTKGDIKFKS